MVTPLVPHALRARFAAAEARYRTVLEADQVFSRQEARGERTRTIVFLARWHSHIDMCKRGALDCWFAGGVPMDAVLRAFDDAVGEGVPRDGPTVAR